VLTGAGLVVVLAVGAQLVAARARLPAIVLLLPVGFVAGILTDDVHPDKLLGNVFPAFVALATGLILFESGTRLNARELRGGLRGVVSRLCVLGVLVPLVLATAAVAALFGYDTGVAAMIAAVLVVSGPTVVLPLLDHVRPVSRVRTVLSWEGILIDPIGALVAVAVFHAVSSGGGRARVDFQETRFVLDIVLGTAIGAAAGLALVPLLAWVNRFAPRHAVTTTFMAVIAVVVGSDLLQDDSGLMAATVMGIVIAHQRRIDFGEILLFDQTLVELLIGVLFVMLAASVSPSEIEPVLLPAIGLIAALALAVRPLIVVLATWRSGLPRRERLMVAGIAPRGIVAAATGSTFGLALAADGVPDAERILPVVFVVIFGTVVLYGVAAEPLATRLGLRR
jgi:NhaP-type Na+/H+ or K+/H+ antiporter